MASPESKTSWGLLAVNPDVAEPLAVATLGEAGLAPHVL